MPETPEESQPQLDTSEEAEFLATARKRFKLAASEEETLREPALRDLRFTAGDQWDEKIRNDRARAGRPALTFNRCHTFVQTVSNEARQQKPQIKFIPAEENDKDTAEIYEGLARHIQYGSDAQVAYETAVEYSAGGSFGYYRFLTEYADDEGDDLDLKVIPVYDPFAVYGILVPACFGIESRFAFVVEDMPLENYKREYPDSAVHSMDIDEASRQSEGWIGRETVRIAEYWYVQETQETITTPQGKKRKVSRKTVKFCKINGLEVLPGSETEWPGKCIPIIPVLGKQIIIDGKPQLFSVVRFQKGAQELINVYKTRIAETLMTAPIQPYKVVAGQIRTPQQRQQWDSMNTTLRPYVEYEQTDNDGRQAPPPDREVFEPPIAALSAAAAQEIDDMKALAGIYDASLGARSNETSGLAIQRRQQQADITNMHFMDNLERAFKQGGQVIAELIPKIYDGARMIRILGEDETPKVVRINEEFLENGRPKMYRVGGEEVVKFDVVVTMGRSFSTKRLESFDMMSQVLQANPQILPNIGDIFFRNSDLAGADQLAERFKRMLPPELQDDEKQDPKAQVQMLQKQMQEMSKQHELLTQALNEAQDTLESKQAELQAKHDIVAMQEQTKLAIAQLQAQLEEGRLNAQREMEELKLMHQGALQSSQQTHQAGMAERQGMMQQQQSQMADQEQERMMTEQQMMENQSQEGA